MFHHILLLFQCYFIVVQSTPLVDNEVHAMNTSVMISPTQNSESDPEQAPVEPPKPSFANGVVNTNILTLFHYNGSQIYVYSSVANDGPAANTPHKWIFYYVPIMAPVVEHDSPWVWSLRNEVRVKLLLGDKVIDELARKAIENKYDQAKLEYSKYWDIAPLMIDSLTAYIVQSSSSPISGIEPFHAIHPNSLVMIFRFKCSTEVQARAIAEKLNEGEYEIEIAFYFAGFREGSTNFVSITGDQIKGVSSKTSADGGNTNAEYIHRSQVSQFVSLYNTNVQKMIYIENTELSAQSLSAGMEETFISLMKQAMDELTATKLSVQAFEQVWSASDLNPNRITSEMNSIFIYNKTATEQKHDGSNYFNLNWEKLRKSHDSVKVGFWQKLTASVMDLFSVGASAGLNVEVGKNKETMDKHQETSHQTVSDKYIYDTLQQNDVQVEWTGEKFQPKSFNVFKITELTDRLQTALITKQMIVDKNRNAMIRIISTINTPHSIKTNSSQAIQFLTGEIKLYTSSKAPPSPWLSCNGSAISRIKYQRLFAVIGVQYGPGDRVNTFNLPDFRGRVPVGVDVNETHVKIAKVLGKYGGLASHQMTTAQLPAHRHGQGSLYTTSNGAHTHTIIDNGHNHGGRTVSERMGPGGWGMAAGKGYGSDHAFHDHTIPRGYTGITMAQAGDHSHTIYGETGPIGSGEAFSIMPPYVTVNYIIYAD